MKALLYELLRTRMDPPAWSWFEKALEAANAPVNENVLLGYYAGASRRMGKRALSLGEEERSRVRAMDPELPLDHWGVDEAARALVLLSLDHLAPDDFAHRVLQCYELGDSREQESWLRGLALLPHCERFLSSAVDACRTNIIPLFEAIACENPYPSRQFPELNFNQMVLKCLFNAIAVNRIIGLEKRLNKELSRMADDYVSEREAAGRTVPTDIWMVLAPCIESEGLSRVHRYLHHENSDHRLWAARGLGFTANGESRRVLAGQREIERDGRVKEAIETSLARLS